MGKREDKTAYNKRALINALINQMKSIPFGEIKISSLCKEAKVSSASFYNYFPQKSDMIVYFIQLWTLETTWIAQHEVQGVEGVSLINEIFIRTADSVRKYPDLMGEIVAFQATHQMPQNWPALTAEEKRLAFPQYIGIDDIASQGLDAILEPNILLSIEKGELPQETDVMAVIIALTSLFFGIPILISKLPTNMLEAIYQKQLDIIWSGVGYSKKD